MSSVSKLRKMTIDNRDTDTDRDTDKNKNTDKVSAIRQMTIDNRDIDKATSQTKMQKLRKDSEIHEVHPIRGMSSYEEGIALKKLRAYYEDINKNKNAPAGGFNKRFRKTNKGKRSTGKRSTGKRSKKRTKTRSRQ